MENNSNQKPNPSSDNKQDDKNKTAAPGIPANVPDADTKKEALK